MTDPTRIAMFAALDACMILVGEKELDPDSIVPSLMGQAQALFDDHKHADAYPEPEARQLAVDLLAISIVRPAHPDWGAIAEAARAIAGLPFPVSIAPSPPVKWLANGVT
jgi:hypothetical protein